jgi:hypothetical protein
VPDEVIVYRCEYDGQLTLLRSEQANRQHLNHRCRPVWPPLWARLLLYAGWRP